MSVWCGCLVSLTWFCRKGRKLHFQCSYQSSLNNCKYLVWTALGLFSLTYLMASFDRTLNTIFLKCIPFSKDTYRVFIKYCFFFQRILESLPIGVTIHSYCFESFEGLLQRCRQGRGWSELWKTQFFLYLLMLRAHFYTYY